MSYARPTSLEATLELLERYGGDASVLAGGQSLMPTLNMRLSQPETLIDINRLDALRGISLEDGEVRIGALARHVEVLESDIVARELRLVAQAIVHVAHVAVRNRGTFGGSIALADPAAELPACVVALGATIVVRSEQGERVIPAEDFFLGLFETERRPNELLTEVRIPVEAPGYVSVFTELSQRHGDFALAGVAARVRAAGEEIIDARLVYFASEDRPTLGTAAMAAVRARRWNEESKNAMKAALADDLDPLANLHGSAEMKLHLQRVLTARALDTAIERASAA